MKISLPLLPSFFQKVCRLLSGLQRAGVLYALWTLLSCLQQQQVVAAVCHTDNKAFGFIGEIYFSITVGIHCICRIIGVKDALFASYPVTEKACMCSYSETSLVVCRILI